MKKYQFGLGLLVALLGAAWLIYLANLPLPVRSVRRGEVLFATTLFLVGIALILYDTFSRNRSRERTAEIERNLRMEVSRLQEYAGLSDIDLNNYIRKVTGKPGVSSLNVYELLRIRLYVQQTMLSKREGDSETVSP